MKAVFALAKREYLDSFRNKKIIGLTIFFVALILLISYLGGVEEVGGDPEVRGLQHVVEFGSTILDFIIPIIAIMVGYKTVSKEIESSSVSTLLTSHLTRKNIVLGKFLGLFSILATSILVGLGTGAILIGILASFENLGMFVQFILISLLYGGAFLAISMMASCFINRNSKALAAGVLIWFFFHMIWDIILTGFLYVFGHDLTPPYPSTYWYADLLNPTGIYWISSIRLGGGIPGIPDAGEIPSILDLPVLTIALFVWILVPLLIGILYFDKKDL